ncbi:DNA polymerase III subunit [Larkinella humicola]|uniref:DNA polymerase III subunit delta n=1 Tax=Larkinella humicola TaxID=2607654 RepID=A0A5N1JJI4_9BACT|nr:DNA polymerase III subunit delta [Larkinella humicola]KAA9356314.1 DNA polymerase III subunit delta [Larkinella humicola]
MQFSEIIGHDDTKRALTRAVQTNHLAHAQLFDGPPGSANLALALAFATFINCENRQELPDGLADSCGRCPSCTKMNKLVHPDLSIIFPVAGSKVTSESFMADWRKFVAQHPYRVLDEWLAAISIKQGNIPVEEARELMGKLSLKAYEGEYKIVLIWCAENLHTATANALLKLLEEPPARTLFLLVTNQSDKLLITILSRTQRVAVQAFSDDEVATHLRQHLNLPEKRAREMAYLADGNLSEAIRLSEEEPDPKDGEPGSDRHAWFAEWMRFCYRQDLIALVKQADGFDALGKEKQRGLLDYSLNLCRDLFLWKHGVNELLRLPAEERTFVENFGKVLEPEHLEHMVGNLNEAVFHIERNVRAKMVMMDLSLTFSSLIRNGK